MAPEYQDPSAPSDEVRVDAWSAKVGRERHWYNPLSWSSSSQVIEKRAFNRFADDDVPSQAKRRKVESPTGATREASQDGKCWTEEQVDVFVYVTPHLIKKRWIEYWRVDETLTEWYAFIRDVGHNAEDLASGTTIKELAKAAGLNPGSSGTGPSPGNVVRTVATGAAIAAPIVAGEAGAAAEGLTVGAAMGAGTLTEVAAVGASAVYATATTAAALGKAATTVAGQVVIPAVAITGAAVVPFVATTRAMERKVKSSEKLSEGWEFVEAYEGPETFESSVGVWRTVGPIRDCPGATEEHWTTPQPQPPLPPEPQPEPRPQPQPRTSFDWRHWWWLGGVLLVGALALVGGGLLAGGHGGTAPAAGPLMSAGSAVGPSASATSTAAASANPAPGPVGLGWTGTTVELTFADLTFGQCPTSQRAGVPPTFGGGWTMATQPGAGADVAVNMLALPTSPFAPALDGSIAPTGALHVTGDGAIESMNLSLTIPPVPAGALPAPVAVTGSAQVALHASTGDCQTGWTASGALAPPSATTTAPFTLGLALNYGHSGATSSVCLSVRSEPTQAGAPVTATISGPGVVGPSQISSTLLADGTRHGHFSIDLYGSYVVKTMVTSHGVSREVTQAIDVTAAPGQGTCP